MPFVYSIMADTTTVCLNTLKQDPHIQRVYLLIVIKRHIRCSTYLCLRNLVERRTPPAQHKCEQLLYGNRTYSEWGRRWPPWPTLDKTFHVHPIPWCKPTFSIRGFPCNILEYIVVVTHIDEFPFHPTLLTRTHHLKQNSTTPSPSNFYFLYILHILALVASRQAFHLVSACT